MNIKALRNVASRELKKHTPSRPIKVFATRYADRDAAEEQARIDYPDCFRIIVLKYTHG